METQDKMPCIDDYQNILDYIVALELYTNKKREPLRKSALTFLNKWLKTKSDNYINGLSNFRYKSIDTLPSDEETKQFLIKYFHKYNDEFNLEYIYDENAFTTENLLDFYKDMLHKIGFDLIKHKTKTKKPSISIVFKKEK